MLHPVPNAGAPLHMRDPMTLKMILIGILAALLLVPLHSIHDKVVDRRERQATVRERIAAGWSRSQSVLAAVLVQPYTVQVRRESGTGPFQQSETITEQRVRLVFPQFIDVEGTLMPERRFLGIYSAPVYRAALTVRGELDMQALGRLREDITREEGFLEPGSPFLSVALSDQSGVAGEPVITIGNGSLTVLPGSGIPGWPAGFRVALPGDAAGPDGRFRVRMELRGTDTFHVVPAAGLTAMRLSSSWRHPDFTDSLLPVSRRVGADGFEARWSVTRFNSPVLAAMGLCGTGNCEPLRQGAGIGVRLFDAVDIYSLADRATRYGILFIGMVFAAFLVMELTRDLRIHPVQYSFAGLALALFFLLLVALSEHVPFGLAYAMAAGACIALLGTYTRHLLGGRPGAAWFSTGLGAVYGLLYVILRAEDYSLLMGACLTFVALAAIMIATWHVDWYAGAGGNGAHR